MATIRQVKRTGNWEAIVRRKGHKPISATFESYEEAEGWATLEEARIIGERRGGRAVEAARGLTLAQILDKYESEITPTKRRPELELSLIKFWRDTELADRPLRDVDAVAIQAVVNRIRDDRPPRDLKTQAEIDAWRRREKRRSPNRVRLYLALLSHVFTVGRKNWKLGLGNPVRDVERPSVPKLAARRPVRADLLRVLAVCSPKLRQYAEIAIETGMRRTELAELDWSQVKFGQQIIELYEGQTKSGRAREVSLSPRALELLRGKWKEDGEPNLGRLWDIEDPHSWTTAWRKACKRAKVDPRRCNIKGLRHERGGSLGAAGWSPVQIAQQLGHEQWSTSRIYTDVRSAEIIERLAEVPPVLGVDNGTIATSDTRNASAGSNGGTARANSRTRRASAADDTARKTETVARSGNDGLGAESKREGAR